MSICISCHLMEECTSKSQDKKSCKDYVASDTITTHIRKEAARLTGVATVLTHFKEKVKMIFNPDQQYTREELENAKIFAIKSLANAMAEAKPPKLELPDPTKKAFNYQPDELVEIILASYEDSATTPAAAPAAPAAPAAQATTSRRMGTGTKRSAAKGGRTTKRGSRAKAAPAAKLASASAPTSEPAAGDAAALITVAGQEIDALSGKVSDEVLPRLDALANTVSDLGLAVNTMTENQNLIVSALEALVETQVFGGIGNNSVPLAQMIEDIRS